MTNWLTKLIKLINTTKTSRSYYAHVISTVKNHVYNLYIYNKMKFEQKKPELLKNN